MPNTKYSDYPMISYHFNHISQYVMYNLYFALHMKSIHAITNAQKPLIIAHRGYKAHYPENTLSSFRAALDYGSDMIELDVDERRLELLVDDIVLEERWKNWKKPENRFPKGVLDVYTELVGSAAGGAVMEKDSKR